MADTATLSIDFLAVLAVLAVAGCAPATVLTPAGDTVVVAADGSASPGMANPAGGVGFSDDQADRGRDVFRSTCAECHYSSEFRDRQFKFRWRLRSAGDLYDQISMSMPEDAPGSLEVRQYVDIVTYILRMNGLEPGSSEISAPQLRSISLAPISGN